MNWKHRMQSSGWLTTTLVLAILMSVTIGTAVVMAQDSGSTDTNESEDKPTLTGILYPPGYRN